MGISSLWNNIKEGNVGAAIVDGVGVVVDAVAIALPVVPGGASSIIKAARAADDVVDVAKTTSKTQKTYQTYTKTNKTTNEVYVGRTSGTGTPYENIKKRDQNHHKNKSGYGPAQLDKSSTNPDAIRGQEQYMIDKNGGAKSIGGTSGNAINGVSPKNPKAQQYENARKKEFNEK